MSPLPLLDVQDLRVAFAGHEVVKGVSLQIMAGEKVALVGESGSGKTITALSLLGLVAQAQTSGRALLRGRDLLAMSESELLQVRGGDVAMVFQEPMTALNPLMTVGDQVAEVFRIKKALSQHASWLSAIDLLASTGLPEPAQKAKAYPHQLSGGQRQRVVIAMALACEPRLLLADEPTTALDVTLRGQMLDLLSQLQRQTSMAILLITHDLPLVKRFADRVVVMERGEVVEQGLVADVFSAPAHPYTRQLLDSHPRRDVLVSPPPEGLLPVLQGRGVRVSYPVRLPGLQGWFRRGESVAVQNADFDLCPGQTLGVVGESGSGKSTLALAALDLIPFTGDILVAGQPWSAEARANRRQRQQVQVVFQDPFSSLSPRMTVEQIVGEGLLVHEPELTTAQRQRRVVVALQEVGLLPADEPAGELEADRTSLARLVHAMLARYPHEFSGGQRQRLAIARALVVRPAVLVLDEPTSALDVTVQKQVLELLQRLQREMGLSYLLITHDMDVIRAMAHHVMVLQAGEVVEFGALSQVLANPRHPHTQALMLASGCE